MTEFSETKFVANMTQVAHRNLGATVAEFRAALIQNPAFAGRALVWAASGGSAIRDTKAAAVIALLQASDPILREAGRVLLVGQDVYDIEGGKIPGLEPHVRFQVSEFLRSPWMVLADGVEVARFPNSRAAEKALPRLKNRLERDKTGRVVRSVSLQVEFDTNHVEAKRQIRGAMKDWLVRLEENTSRWNGVWGRNKREMRLTYKYLHVPASENTVAILRGTAKAEGEEVYAQIAAAGSAAEKARLVIQHKVPFEVATSLLDDGTPESMIALIEVATPTQALNMREKVESSGILNVREVRDAYEKKISKAASSVARITGRKSAQGQDASVQAAVEKALVKAYDGKPIVDDTLVMIDASGSMSAAITYAVELARKIAPAMKAKSTFTSFSETGTLLYHGDGIKIKEVEQAIRMVRPEGYTSMAAGFNVAAKKKTVFSRIVIITDGGENKGSFAQTLRAWADENKASPAVVIIRVGGYAQSFTKSIRDAGFLVDEFNANDDYTSIDQVLALLAGEKAKTLVEKIAEVEFPRRRGWSL